MFLAVTLIRNKSKVKLLEEISVVESEIVQFFNENNLIVNYVKSNFINFDTVQSR